MKTRFGLERLAMGIVMLAAGGMVMAQDAGLVTQVGGAVTVSEAGAKPAPAVSFAKLKAGTRVDVGADGRFQVVYLGSGRQETWGAGSQIEIGDTASKAVKAATLPGVKQLPPAILKGLTQAPTMIADMRSRQGMIRVRAVGDWKRLEEAEGHYAMLRGQAAQDDVTPELYLLSALSELKLYDKMKKPLDEMLVRQPKNEDVRALHAAYAEQMARGQAEKK